MIVSRKKEDWVSVSVWLSRRRRLGGGEEEVVMGNRIPVGLDEWEVSEGRRTCSSCESRSEVVLERAIREVRRWRRAEGDRRWKRRRMRVRGLTESVWWGRRGVWIWGTRREEVERRTRRVERFVERRWVASWMSRPLLRRLQR